MSNKKHALTQIKLKLLPILKNEFSYLHLTNEEVYKLFKIIVDELEAEGWIKQRVNSKPKPKVPNNQIEVIDPDDYDISKPYIVDKRTGNKLYPLNQKTGMPAVFDEWDKNDPFEAPCNKPYKPYKPYSKPKSTEKKDSITTSDLIMKEVDRLKKEPKSTREKTSKKESDIPKVGLKRKRKSDDQW
jgi:hypothetical protein